MLKIHIFVKRIDRTRSKWHNLMINTIFDWIRNMKFKVGGEQACLLCICCHRPCEHTFSHSFHIRWMCCDGWRILFFIAIEIMICSRCGVTPPYCDFGVQWHMAWYVWDSMSVTIYIGIYGFIDCDTFILFSFPFRISHLISDEIRQPPWIEFKTNKQQRHGEKQFSPKLSPNGFHANTRNVVNLLRKSIHHPKWSLNNGMEDDNTFSSRYFSAREISLFPLR